MNEPTKINMTTAISDELEDVEVYKSEESLSLSKMRALAPIVETFDETPTSFTESNVHAEDERETSSNPVREDEGPRREDIELVDDAPSVNKFPSSTCEGTETPTIPNKDVMIPTDNIAQDNDHDHVSAEESLVEAVPGGNEAGESPDDFEAFELQLTATDDESMSKALSTRSSSSEQSVLSPSEKSQVRVAADCSIPKSVSNKVRGKQSSPAGVQRRASASKPSLAGQGECFHQV